MLSCRRAALLHAQMLTMLNVCAAESGSQCIYSPVTPTVLVTQTFYTVQWECNASVAVAERPALVHTLNVSNGEPLGICVYWLNV